MLVSTIRRIWILLETDLWGFTCICQSYHITFVRSEFNFCFFGHLNCTASNVDDWWDPQFIPRCIWPLFSCLLFSRNVLLRFLSNTYWDKIWPILGPPDFETFWAEWNHHGLSKKIKFKIQSQYSGSVVPLAMLTSKLPK